jgi:molybdenum cofactor cytidylyltransferase
MSLTDGALCGIVLAAGGANRFGAPKQLASLGDDFLLERPLSVLAASPVDERIVVLGADADRILGEVDLMGATPVLCPDWESGQSRSLAAGLRAADDAEAAVLLLGDQPFVSVAAVERVLAERREGTVAIRATYGGDPGHPVVLERELFAEAMALDGDAGARTLLRGRTEGQVRVVACDDVGSGIDVDTVEALAAAERMLEEG